MICWVKEQDVRQINREKLKAIDADLVDLPQSDMYQHVSRLTDKQCFDESKYVITLVTLNLDHRRKIVDSMVQSGLQQKGRTPFNCLED